MVELFGRDSDDAEAEARRRDTERIAVYIPPYNDPDVIAGQGTIGAEILEDWPACDAIVVPIGGGGLIAGIGLWAKAVKPGLRLVGVQPSASPPMYAYLESNSTKPMPIAPTLADGVAGNIERDSITWKMCRQLVDEVVLVDEEQIADAMRWAIEVPPPGGRGERRARDRRAARAAGRPRRSSRVPWSSPGATWTAIPSPVCRIGDQWHWSRGWRRSSIGP